MVVELELETGDELLLDVVPYLYGEGGFCADVELEVELELELELELGLETGDELLLDVVP